MNRRDFLNAFAFCAAGAAAPGFSGAAEPRARELAKSSTSKKRSRFLLSSRGCGRATGYAETNKIVTLGDKTHVAWLDSVEAGFRVRVRTLDRTSGEWSPTYTVGEAHDNHGGPALTLDGEGHLHIVYYPHHHPFRYRRSTRPNDASAWDEEERFGERCTYPTLLAGPDDTLYLTCRQSNTRNEPWVVNLYSKKPGGSWSGPTAILRADEKDYSHFQEALAWGPDRQTMHLSTRMYGGNPRIGHTVGYMRSRDFGRSWQNARGRSIPLPATSKTISVIAGNTGLDEQGLRCGSVAVAPDGTPHVLYNDAVRGVANAQIARLEPSGEWRRLSLSKHVSRTLPGWSASMPGGLVFGEDGRMYAALTALPPGPDGKTAPPTWGDPASEVVWLESADRGRTFSARLLSEANPNQANWLPNLERPTGHNRVSRPGLIYTAGTKGEKNTQIVSNGVYWVG